MTPRNRVSADTSRRGMRERVPTSSADAATDPVPSATAPQSEAQVAAPRGLPNERNKRESNKTPKSHELTFV